MRVKICGITRRADAEIAASLGAWAVGFVFWRPSRRFVDPDSARVLARGLPSHVARVGVFVDEQPAEVARVSALVGLDYAQLHGSEDAPSATGLTVGVIKTVLPTDEAIRAWPPTVLLLVDHLGPEARGGTGRLADWAAAARISAARPVILAGGLTPENVGQAIRAVRPFAVDVSSGVEDRPGVKAPSRVEAFLAAASAAEEVSR